MNSGRRGSSGKLPEDRLRVGIATSGRFHLLDLARELDALGVRVRFYSYVSRKRELHGYAIADRIAVPSAHVVESFTRWPEHARKLCTIPYGVDLAQFPLIDRELRHQPTVLFVGNWSYQKGADVLTRAIEQMSGV